MEKYIWTETQQDYWPEFRTKTAVSYNDAVEKLIMQYGNELEDDNIFNTIDDWEQLREYLNTNHSIVLSDLENIEEL